MKISKVQKINLEKIDVLVIPVFQSSNFDPIFACCPEGEFLFKPYRFTGKVGDDITFFSLSLQKLVVILGAGTPDNTIDIVKTAKHLTASVTSKKLNHVLIRFPQNLTKLKITQKFWKLFIDFLFINNYHFDSYKKDNNKNQKLEKIDIYIDEKKASAVLTSSLLKERRIIAQHVDQVRDLVNGPPSEINPDSLVEEFKQVAQENQLDLSILRKKELQNSGMNGILAVGQASPYEPALIRLSYNPKNCTKRIALVGKGITFDSGGLNLKSSSGMKSMKCDMSGAAVVLGVMAAISKMQLPVMVNAFIPVAENMPGHYAYKPGDILTFKNDKTVEIIDTDCEGRLLLADALITAAQEKPHCIIELSTLTGAVVRALGDSIAGVLGTDESLVHLLVTAGKNTGERLCQFPLSEDYKESIFSKVADLKNCGYGPASTIKAALFLKEFTAEIPFIHIDIAGTAFISSSNAFYNQEGATGFGARLIIEFLNIWLKNKINN